MKVFDGRWVGEHGIGRFAKEVQSRMPGFLPIGAKGRPSSPLDPFMLHRYLKAARPALFFSPGYNPPAGNPCPFVFCVHDLNHLYIKENSSALKRAYYRYLVQPGIHHAQVVITGSEFSKSQICEWSGADSRHVVAVGYGVSDAFVVDGRQHDEQGRPYFLCVGNHKVHKNLLRSIQAFARSSLSSEFMLLFSGTPSPQLQSEIDRLGLHKQIRFVGGVSDAQLADLYRGAAGLVFVSLYEGFGLPIIESMACGTPVLTSTATAMPEVAGDAAILVDPYDVDAIVDGMRRLAEDSDLRKTLRENGLKRAKLFSWEKTGTKIREALATCA